jgi:sulfur-oxidizing protein SoxY
MPQKHSLTDHARPTRRQLLNQGLALGGLSLSLWINPAAATPESMRAAIRNVTGDANIRKGKVKIELPALVESGNAVPLSVSVTSPMTAADYVKAIYVFNEKNPQPNVLGVKLGPRSGRASFNTRIRLADTQTVIAVAELSDGSFWGESVEVIVTLPACLETL